MRLLKLLFALFGTSLLRADTPAAFWGTCEVSLRDATYSAPCYLYDQSQGQVPGYANLWFIYVFATGGANVPRVADLVRAEAGQGYARNSGSLWGSIKVTPTDPAVKPFFSRVKVSETRRQYATVTGYGWYTLFEFDEPAGVPTWEVDNRASVAAQGRVFY